MAHGHPDAPHYPIGMVYDEARLVVEHINAKLATEAVLTQMAVSAILSKSAGKEFRKALQRLREG